MKTDNMRRQLRPRHALFCLVVTAGLVVGCAAGRTSLDAELTAAEGLNQAPERTRLLALNNTRNTRDLGGYTTTDGRSVKWDLLFRSDGLDTLDEADLSALEKLRIAVVTDFRSDGERAAAPDRLPVQIPPIRYRTLAVNDPAVDVVELGRKVYAGELTRVDLDVMVDKHGAVTDPALRRVWGQWLRDLAEPGNLPQLFHCTAGKDRTGFAAALILLTLGVPEDQVMDDFLLSNDTLKPQIDAGVKKILQVNPQADADSLRLILGVSRATMEGAIRAMESQYGSVDGYIEKGLGIDAATRRRLHSLLLD